MQRIGWDTETSPIAPGMLTPEGVVLSYYRHPFDDEGEIETEFKEDGTVYQCPAGALLLFPRALDWLEYHLKGDTVLIGHNQAYDLAVCAATRPRLLPLIFRALEEGRLRDTMVRGKLIMIARGEHKYMTRDDGKKIKTLFSLEFMARIFLGRDDINKKDAAIQQIRTGYGKLIGVPLQEWGQAELEYPLSDASLPLEVFEAQEKYCATSPIFRRSGGILPNEIQQTCAAFALHLMSCWGISTDGERVSALKAKLLHQLSGAHEFLMAAGLVHNTGSKKKAKWSKNTKEIKRRIEEGFAKINKSVPLTDTGQTSTSAEVKIASGDPDLIRMASFSLAETLLNSFIPLLERGVTHPITARWNVLVESGRVSCSDPNLLNPPAEEGIGVRECFVARPGYVFIGVDYRVIEMRVFAQICLDLFGRSKMAEVFRRGGDPHDELGARLFHCTVEEAHVRKIQIKTGAIGLDGTPEIREIDLRDFCKMTNFGLLSGMGEDSFVEYARGFGVYLSPQEAHQIRESWFETWPEVKLYFSWVSQQVPHDEATIIQLRSGRVRGGVRFTSAVNTQFQGLTADGAKQGLWLTVKECFLKRKSPLFGSRPVIHMYDENVIEAPEEKATEAAARLQELMIEGMRQLVPDIPIETSKPVVMKHWSKQAKSGLIDGKLEVWDVV